MDSTAAGYQRQAAIRAELRAVVHDLAELLLAPGSQRHVLIDGIRHALALADLAGIPPGVLRTLLRNLQRDLAGKAPIDHGYFAAQLTSAADRL